MTSLAAHEVVCIQCPVACRVKLSVDGEGAIRKIIGYQCKEGKEYAPREYESPQRVLTTTVRTEGSKRPVLPVRSEGFVPKDILRQCIRFLSGVSVKPPLRMGEIVVPNILDTGIDIICTDDLLV